MSGDEDARRLAHASLDAGDATGWFERLYAEAGDGRAEVPWDRPDAAESLRGADLAAGAGRAALVVGCGPGRDAEFLAGLGYATTAFDISDTAIRLARERHPDTRVDYHVADLFDPPPQWRRSFDLVVESNNVQALPRELRARAISAVRDFVAPGGTLLVLAFASATADDDGPPWPLTRAEVDSVAGDGVRGVRVEEFGSRWRAWFVRES
ncbi:class I SAM-dependent methyltransferase [Actinoplanes sp. TBRC 11911]|uniref:class I SAM-dependent methyltransferase n=1 Tax=Actinoplanes sp. TBRC 11911 TaxID=2729386 RepID=UPI00145FB274|nr:class I SAM-dependent methyltransferase [Actinoplanes sp. TBRC 11911]NMO56271.1 class I SAM-dependent methyltransferase [Actinoplanes sp. TBRC 11911]